MSLLFAKNSSTATALSSLKAVYAIDCSGSTAGDVLRREIMSASMLTPYIAHAQTIAWNSTASRVASLSAIRSEGMTNPSSIVPFLQGAQSLVLYTDGQIDIDEMDKFQRQMVQLPPIPIVVVFTLSNSCTLERSSIAAMQQQVNLSIPEACLKMSNDVCVVVNVFGVHKLLMAKGAFNVFGRLPTLRVDMLLSELVRTSVFSFSFDEKNTKKKEKVDFDMTMLKTCCFRTLPAGQINLNGFAEPLVLESLYNLPVDEELPYQVLESLCDRVYFPQFDTARLQSMLSRRLRALNENKEVDMIRQQLATIAVDAVRAGGEEHRALLARLHEAGRRRNKEVGADVSRLRSLLQRFLQMLSEYAVDRTSIVLGSNRARNAKQIDSTVFDEELDESTCVLVPECPIYLQQGIACVLLQAPSFPSSGNATLLELCTCDNAMEV